MTSTGENGTWAVMPACFRIFVVGRTNICRSPLAAQILQNELDIEAVGEFDVSSAGTHAIVGSPAVAEALELAERRGICLRGFRARQVDADDISEADLVLVMDRALRREVVNMVPQALRTTFTLLEFARILPMIPPEELATPAGRWQSLAALAPRYRTPPKGKASDDDVSDPRFRSLKAYGRMNTQIVSAVDVIRRWEVQGCASDPRA